MGNMDLLCEYTKELKILYGVAKTHSYTQEEFARKMREFWATVHKEKRLSVKEKGYIQGYDACLQELYANEHIRMYTIGGQLYSVDPEHERYFRKFGISEKEILYTSEPHVWFWKHSMKLYLKQ